MASDIEIANLALQRAGVTATIDSLDQRIKEAMVINTCYKIIREKTLTDAPFPFSRKYSSLALSGTAPLKWKYRYVYPNDCLAVRAIFPNVGGGYDPITIRSIGRTAKLPYEICVDDTGEKTICTDIQNAVIEYSMNVSNPVRFSSSFVSAFAWGITAEICLPLARDIKFSQNAFAMYNNEILMANASALNEETIEEQPESPFLTARL